MLHSVLAVNKLRNIDDVLRAPGPGSAARIATELDIRPLNARSLMLSALLGSHPPEMPVSALVDLGATFSMPAGTVRTALSRMAATGEVTVDAGRYRLSGRLVERQAEQDRGRTEPTSTWDGSWWMATVTSDRRTAADRRRFRAAMVGARMGELRPESWMRPANVDVALDLPDVVIVRGPLTSGDPTALATRLWDLDASESRAALLEGALDLVAAALDRHDDRMIAPAFTTFAACLRFLRAEPQLPVELAPSPAARRLRATYGDAERALQARLRDLYRAPR